MSAETFLVDSNTFITPFKTYYPFDFAPTFWEFLKNHIKNGNIVIIGKVYDEVAKGTDDLSRWLQSLDVTQIDHRTPDVLHVYTQIMSHIQSSASANGTKFYNDKALQEWADNNRADAWLVATAKAKGYTLITFERSNSTLGTTTSGHPKIPDVAAVLDVKFESLFYMMRLLQFSFN